MENSSIKKTFTIKSNLKEIDPLVNNILACLKDANVNNEILYDVRLVTQEALINAVKHGNKLNPQMFVAVDFDYSNDTIKITVQDEGRGYDYANIPDPTLEENIIKGCGRGVFLIRKLMDEVNFNKAGNRMEMIKRISH